jgi:hypothetical protein
VFGVREKGPEGCSKRLSSKAATSEEARRTLRYVEPLSEARTKLADFFSILPEGDGRVHHPDMICVKGTSLIRMDT